MFLYYALVGRHYGAAVSKIIRWEHLSRLKLAAPDLGNQTEALLVLVGNAIELAARSETRLPDGTELPPEVHMAIYFLYNVAESPYYGKDSAVSSREFQDASFDIAGYLVWNRDKAVQHFSSVLKTLTIDARDLKAWVDSKCTQA